MVAERLSEIAEPFVNVAEPFVRVAESSGKADELFSKVAGWFGGMVLTQGRRGGRASVLREKDSAVVEKRLLVDG
jgi:hypothetical protein